MTEPREIASSTEQVADGLWHWRISNSAIGGGISSSHAIRVAREDGRVGCVLVDPVRLDPHAMQQLPPVEAIVLTARCHQRAAWHYRAETAAEVWLPAGAEGAEEQPDHRYEAGSTLPGGLQALHTPGPELHHFCLQLPAFDALIVSDLVQRTAEGMIERIPAEYHDDPASSQESLEYLLEQEWSLLLLDHGAPMVSGGRSAIEGTLRRD